MDVVRAVIEANSVARDLGSKKKGANLTDVAYYTCQPKNKVKISVDFAIVAGMITNLSTTPGKYVLVVT